MMLALVAVYLLYIVYGLITESEDTTMPTAVRILFIALFSVAAVALLVYAYFIWKNRNKKEEQSSQDDENELK